MGVVNPPPVERNEGDSRQCQYRQDPYQSHELIPHVMRWITFSVCILHTVFMFCIINDSGAVQFGGVILATLSGAALCMFRHAYSLRGGE